jgi:acyl carrier protein
MEEKIKEIIFNKFNREVDKDTDLSELAEDSFARVEMLFLIEEELGKRLSEDEILQIENVGDLIKVLQK